MPFTQLILLTIPTPVLCLMIIGASTTLSVVTLLIVRSFVPHHRLKQHNDVAGSIFATVGVLYAVLLAFVVIVVWQSFDKSNLNVQKEANCVVDLYRDAEAFSPEFKKEVVDLLKDYIKGVIDEEWKTMERGEPSQRVTETLGNMWHAYSSYLPKNITEQTFFEESVRKLNELGELRRMRLMDSNTGIHPVLWFVLIVGGVVTMIFVSFFGAENLKAQVVMALLLSMLVGLILFTIASMDYPFTGSVSISPEIFKVILSCVK
jgi:FtsH-binding integral membrane protein